MIKYFILLFFMFPLFSKPIEIDNNFKKLVIGKYLKYYEDTENKLKIEDIIKPEFEENFKESKMDKLNFGYTNSAYWVRFEMQPNISEKTEFLLEHSYPTLDSLQLFIPQDDGSWNEIQAGDIFPFKQRDLQSRNYLFKIKLYPDKKTIFFMKFKSTGSMQIPLKLYDKNYYLESLNHERFALGIYYGIILVIIVYNLILFFSLNDSSLIYYVLYLTSFLFYQLGLNGISFEYIWGNYPVFNSILPFFISCSGFFIILFTKKFLKIASSLWIFQFILNGFIIIWITIGALSLTFHFYSFVIKTGTIFLMTVFGFLLFLSAFLYFKGYKPARFYLLAFTSLIIGTISFGLKNLGFLPSNFFTEYGMQIGSALESILLSLAVADKILIIREEKDIAKNKFIHIQEKAIATQKNLIKSYARFIPEQLLTFLGKDTITEVNLGDFIQKNMTVLFSDIRSFTTLTESMSPEESFSFINSYLEMIAPCIRKYNGYIDKFIGDGVMALFPGKPQDATDASIEMLHALFELNTKRKEKNLSNISIGIGIHTGEQIVGVIGEHERMEGTVISDVVNTASRLEGLTKAYASALIISEDVLNELDDKNKYQIRYLDTVRVKGKNKKVRIYEILNGLSERLKKLKMITKEDFEKGIKLYSEKKFNEALIIFQKVLNLDPKDKAVELYITRCNFYIKYGVDPDWEGIETLDFK